MNNPKISIIIPVYNGEKYLRDCIHSIKQQSFDDYEVIFVNDGSSDNSQSLLMQFASEDERCSVHEIPNGGVSKARNFGLQKARGEWITFVDCDDWLEPDYLESLLAMTSNEIDIVMANFYFNKQGNQQTQAECSQSVVLKKDFPVYPLAMMVEDCAAWNKLRISVEILCAACNKLTRRQLITSNSIKFADDLKLNEDGLFHLICYFKARNVVIIDKPLYHYRISETSSNYRYRPEIHDQMMIWKKHFANVCCNLPDKEKKCFDSLSSYRMFLNLMSLYVIHKENKNGLLGKVKMLRTFLNTGIYDVEVVPKVRWFKVFEIFFLKKKYSFLLILMSLLRKKLKK